MKLSSCFRTWCATSSATRLAPATSASPARIERTAAGLFALLLGLESNFEHFPTYPGFEQQLELGIRTIRKLSR